MSFDLGYGFADYEVELDPNKDGWRYILIFIVKFAMPIEIEFPKEVYYI